MRAKRSHHGDYQLQAPPHTCALSQLYVISNNQKKKKSILSNSVHLHLSCAASPGRFSPLPLFFHSIYWQRELRNPAGNHITPDRAWKIASGMCVRCGNLEPESSRRAVRVRQLEEVSEQEVRWKLRRGKKTKKTSGSVDLYHTEVQNQLLTRFHGPFIYIQPACFDEPEYGGEKTKQTKNPTKTVLCSLKRPANTFIRSSEYPPTLTDTQASVAKWCWRATWDAFGALKASSPQQKRRDEKRMTRAEQSETKQKIQQILIP